MVLEELVVKILADTKGFSSDMERVAREAETSAGRVEKSFANLDRIGGRMKSMGRGLTVGITLPFVSYGGSSLIVNFVLIGVLLGVSDTARRRA